MLTLTVQSALVPTPARAEEEVTAAVAAIDRTSTSPRHRRSDLASSVRRAGIDAVAIVGVGVPPVVCMSPQPPPITRERSFDSGRYSRPPASLAPEMKEGRAAKTYTMPTSVAKNAKGPAKAEPKCLISILRQIGAIVIKHGQLEHVQKIALTRILKITLHDQRDRNEVEGLRSKELRKRIARHLKTSALDQATRMQLLNPA